MTGTLSMPSQPLPPVRATLISFVMLVGAPDTLDVWFRSPPYISHDSFAVANAVTLSSITSARRIAKTLLVRFMFETPFVFRKDSFLTFSRYSRETVLYRAYITAGCCNKKDFALHLVSVPALRLRHTDRVFSSLGRLMSSPASPETISFPIAAIQLSMRFILSGRAKARWL